MDKPRKRFGQHFLRDHKIIQRIVAALAPEPGENLLEIGPGLGSITVPILKIAGSLAAIEIDRDLIPILENNCKNFGNLLVYKKDVLDFDLKVAAHNKPLLRIFGNLPYQISTPLIFHMIKFNAVIADMHFMLQKEVADRLTAVPGRKSYSRLSVMAQYHYQIKQLFSVPPQAFRPKPKVNSCVVRLVPHPYIHRAAHNYQRFETIVKQAFSQRRKILRNSLNGLKQEISEQSWVNARINPTKRAENLSVDDFVRLSNFS